MRRSRNDLLGPVVVIVGIGLLLVGSYMILSSWNTYSQCSLAPSSVCTVTNTSYIDFLGQQTYGNLLGTSGLVMIILGGILYLSARINKIEQSSATFQNVQPVLTSPTGTGSPVKYCMNCGQALPSTARFCPFCQHPVQSS